MTDNRFKPLISLLIIFLVAPLLAALASPWIYQWLQSFAAPDSVLDAPFYRVTSRVVLIMVAALLVPAYKLSGLKGRNDWGLPKVSNGWKLLGIGAGLGVVSMLIVYVAGTLLGVYGPDKDVETIVSHCLKILEVIAAGLFIGFFEEILFRGFIQNALRKSLSTGLGFGIVSMLVIYLMGAVLGVFIWDSQGEGVVYLVRKVGQLIAGGLVIGIFVETFFRGLIPTTLQNILGVISAILIGSFLFSIIHFMRPVDPETMNQWNSGILLFGDLFARAGDEFAQEACTLFCMGVVLATLCHWMKSVYVAIGLHAGWVWVMMLFRHFADNRDTMVWLYGTSDWVSKAWIGPIMALAVLVVVALTRKKWIALGAEG